MKKDRRSEPLPTPADELLNAYKLFIEVMENPERMGYIARLNKVRSMSRMIVNYRLLDRIDYYNWKIKDITNEMLRDINFD
jgi:hypothetical protein